MIENDDDDDALSPRLRALLHDGAAGPQVPPGVSDRLLGKVLLSVGAATAVGASTAAATTAATTTTTAATTTASSSGLFSALGFKVAVGLAGVGVVIGGSVAVSQRSSSSSSPAVPVAALVSPVRVVPIVEDPVVVEAPAEPSPAPAVAAPRAQPRKVDVVPPRAAPVVAPTDEAALLERARRALAKNDADGALVAIAEHADRAPHGQLIEEREGLRVLALSRARRVEEAASLGAVFLRRFPDSLLADRVRAATEIR